MTSQSFYATTSEQIEVQRSSVTSLSTETSPVYNIMVEVDLNAMLKTAGVRMPYPMDTISAGEQNIVVTNTVDKLDSGYQLVAIDIFMTALKTAWAATRFAPANATGQNVDTDPVTGLAVPHAGLSLGAQVRDHLGILFDKSTLNDLLGVNTGVGPIIYDPATGLAKPRTATSYLDQVKIDARLNLRTDDFSLLLMSNKQFKQVMDGVADSGYKRQAVKADNTASTNALDFDHFNYKFEIGDSINSIVLVKDADVAAGTTGLVNVDKWIFTIQQSA
jgi:hypothetical protein